MQLCEAHEDIDVVGDPIVLKIPQERHNGMVPIDSVDRVAVGAALLRELAEAGL